MLALLVEPMLGVTLAPTRIFASEKINVIPSRARLAVDCRMPPGMDEDEVRARIDEVLGDPTATSSSSPRRWSATPRRPTRR